MNPHQRDSRQAAELAFVEALEQLEQQLMADEAEDCEETVESRAHHSQPQDWTNHHRASATSYRRSETPSAFRESSATPRRHAASSTPELNSNCQQPNYQPQPSSRRAQSTVNGCDSFQAFEDAAEDIERFIQSRHIQSRQ